ncbi:MAG TPA: antibiotic biosynthesis monooxygenase [Usitatibacter sp.]|jgi:quinol monooxygenase YgiN|nr:antibiotic biosynthesis monooxygenase [Usitatibacter sp.]
MAKILFEVDSRRRAELLAKVSEQAPRRAQHGERSFTVHVDDNARHICYVFLEWESLRSAHRFLESPASRELVAEWPVEKILGAIPLYDLAEQIDAIDKAKK